MQIRSKFYSYPVIAEDSDSFTNSKFSNDAAFEFDVYNLKFILEAEVQNSEIQKMIEEGIVGFVHHLECPQTCFRTVVISGDTTCEYIISDKKINGIVQVCSFLVALKDIPNYTNQFFSSDYKGFKFNIDKGCILGVGNQINLRVNKAKDDLSNTSSIFSIAPNLDSNEVNVIINTSMKTKIGIIIPEKSCNLYKNMSAMLDLQTVMHSMIIIPALMFVFEELKTASDELYLYDDCRWFRSLKKTCKNFNINLDKEGLSTLNIYDVSQKLLDTPLTKALEFLSGDDGSSF